MRRRRTAELAQAQVNDTDGESETTMHGTGQDDDGEREMTMHGAGQATTKAQDDGAGARRRTAELRAELVRTGGGERQVEPVQCVAAVR